ncbi:phosphopantetheine-binding protein [Gibbsiella quercinecans]|uniref:phosphopantetheine-binding protein n=1 Tax=Gibbsiella quercinecans TaxID=929813 RepID=UPI003A4E3677
MNQAIQEFISANSRITQSYFAFTEKVLSLLGNNPNQQQILLQLLAQTENVTQTFLEAHQQLLVGNALVPHAEEQVLQVQEAISTPVVASPTPIHAEESIEYWLRQKLAEMTGFTAASIDLSLEFDQLGLDSLTRMDLQEALIQRYPTVSKICQFEANTPAKLLASLTDATPFVNPDDKAFCAENAVRGIIARLTGFASQDIDLSSTFDALGLDSLGCLDVLETLQSEHPKVKPHIQWLTNLQSPSEMIALLEEKLSGDSGLETSLFQLLHKFGRVSDNDINHETPFGTYLTDGFIQAAVWEKLAQHYSLCSFAGEALMSRRNAGEALTLLNRLG